MSQISKIKVDTVGIANDASFAGQNGDIIQCYEIPCTGTVDGAPASFNVKIYGKGSDQKVKNGLEFNGERSEYQGVVSYILKKANNPDLYKSSSYDKGGFKGGGFKPQHELNALKVAADTVKMALEYNLGCGATVPEEPDAIAERIIKIARDKFVPFLRATTERHDTVAQRDEAKKMQAQTIRQLLDTNGLIPTIQAHGATNGQLAALYEASGSDAVKFIQEVRSKFNEAPASKPEADAPNEFDDDIPF